MATDVSYLYTVVLIWTGFGVLPAVSRPAQDPSVDPSTVMSDARRLIGQGQARAAIEKLQTLDNTTRPEVAELLGVAYYHADDYARAIEYLTPIVSKFPEN